MADSNHFFVNSRLGSVLSVCWYHFPRAVVVIATSFLMLAGCNETPPAELNSSPTLTPGATRPAAQPALPARMQEDAPLAAMVSVDVVGFGDDVAGYQRPAFLATELAGRDISNVSLISWIVGK